MEMPKRRTQSMNSVSASKSPWESKRSTKTSKNEPESI